MMHIVNPPECRFTCAQRGAWERRPCERASVKREGGPLRQKDINQPKRYQYHSLESAGPYIKAGPTKKMKQLSIE